MSTLYQYLPAVASVLSLIYSVLTLFGVRLRSTWIAKRRLVNTLKILSSTTNNFYEAFNPPMRLGNEKDNLFSLLSLYLAGISALIFFTSLEVPPIIYIVAAIATQFGLLEILMMLTNRFISDSDKQLKPTKDQLAQVPVSAISKSLSKYRRKTLFLMITGSLIYLFLLKDSKLVLSSISTEGAFYITPFFLISLLLVFSAKFSQVYTYIEFETLKYFLHTLPIDVELELTYEISRRETRTSIGKLITLGKSLYLSRTDGYFQEVGFTAIVTMSVRDKTRATSSPTNPSQHLFQGEEGTAV